MASSLPYDPFDNEACLPCLSTTGDGQSEDQQQEVQKLAPTIPATNHHQDNRTHPEMKQTEDLLASELHKLSLEERNRALDDVHCVGEQLKETPEMVQKSLSDFDQEVRRARNPIYELATSQNRAYVEDPTFRLKFLRANLYNVDKSVHQMMEFLQNKAKYFGQDKVAREIVLSDLTDEDIAMLLSGVIHMQEERDRMGRPIVHLSEKYLNESYGAPTANRVSYYFWWKIILANPDAQLKGVTGIYHSIFRIPDDIGFIRETMSYFNSIPLRFSALHYCLQTSFWRNLGSNGALHSLIVTTTPHYARVRSRIHHGSSMEIQYQLRGHGIPVDTFPVDVNGNIREAIINLWFQKHLVDTNQTAVFQSSEVAQIPPEDILMDVDFGLSEQESLSSWNEHSSREALLEPVQFSTQMWPSSTNRANPESSGDVVQVEKITPTKIDVLFGRGYRLQWHPGNVRFREFLQQHREEYENVSRQRKREMCSQLVTVLGNSGVRFLQKTESGDWEVNNSTEEVKTKIAQIFREFRKKEQKERSGA